MSAEVCGKIAVLLDLPVDHSPKGVSWRRVILNYRHARTADGTVNRAYFIGRALAFLDGHEDEFGVTDATTELEGLMGDFLGSL